MSTQRDTLKYTLFQLFFWLNIPAVMSFVSNYLLDNGFQNTQIGIIIAVSGAASAFLQPLLASYADLPSSPSLKKIIFILSSCFLLFAVILAITYHRSMLITGLFFGCSIMAVQLLTPLTNSLGMESINQGRNINFGLARGIGSLSYALTCYLLGVLVDASGTFVIPLSVIIGVSLMLVTLLLFPFRKTEHAKKPVSVSSGKGIFEFFFRYRRFSIVLIGCVFIYISHFLINSFAFQIVTGKGGGSSEMGFAMCLASVFELPVMFLFAYMLKKGRCDTWFRISGIFFLLKTAGTLLAPNMLTFFVIQIFQMGGWGLLTVSSVYYVNHIMEEQDTIKGQAYMSMTTTLGTVLGALIGGRIIDIAGVDIMLLFATGCAAIGMLLMLFATEKVPGNQSLPTI